MNDEVTLRYLFTYPAGDSKFPPNAQATLDEGGQWREREEGGPGVTCLAAEGPTKEAIAAHLQKLRDAYGKKDTTRCAVCCNNGWIEENGNVGLVFSLIILGGPHIGTSPSQLFTVILKDANSRSRPLSMSEQIARDIDEQVFGEIAEAMSPLPDHEKKQTP